MAPPSPLSRCWRASSSALRKASASAGRRSGSFCSAQATIWSSSSGAAGLSSRTEGASSATCLSAIETAASAWKGTCPVSSSKRITPIEYRSDCGETGLPCACSGDRYWAVPMIEPVSVMSDAPARAMPKSVTLARPSSSIITLWGLRSRCTTPRRCAKRAARRICEVMSIARRGSIGASAWISSLSVRPSMNSIAM